MLIKISMFCYGIKNSEKIVKIIILWVYMENINGKKYLQGI